MSRERKPFILLDADVLCHKIAYGSTTTIDWNGDGNTVTHLQPDKCRARVEGEIAELVARFKARSVILALSDRKHNFRKDIFADYKAQRTKPKPELWYFIRDMFENGDTGYPVDIRPNLEGDDVLGILATGEFKDNHVVVSIDKDLQTVPCRLFMPQREKLGARIITPHEASKFHMLQTLMGDATDNYPGARKIGKTLAPRILDTALILARDAGPLVPCKDKLWSSIVETYRQQGHADPEGDALVNARCAYILHEGDYSESTKKVNLWNPSQLSLQ